MVYEELRRVHGDTLSARVLLQQASYIVEFFEKENEVPKEFLISEQSEPLGPSLDAAFSDGGWTLLNREKQWADQTADDREFIPKSRLQRQYSKMESSIFPERGSRIAEGWIIEDEE